MVVIFALRKASFQIVLCLEEDSQFLLGGYFAFCGYPTKKRIVPFDAACFPLSETTKIRKSPKIDFTQKFCNGDDTYSLYSLILLLVERLMASGNKNCSFSLCLLIHAFFLVGLWWPTQSLMVNICILCKKLWAHYLGPVMPTDSSHLICLPSSLKSYICKL